MNQRRPTLASLRHLVAAVFLVIALPVPGGLAAQAPPGDAAEVDAYLERNEAEIAEKLRAYNRAHPVIQSWQTARFVIHSRQVEGVEGDRAWVTIQFSVGGGTYKRPGNAIFHFKWGGHGYEVVDHQTIAPGASSHGTPDDGEAAPPLRSQAETEAYIDENLSDITRKLRVYNDDKQVVTFAYWTAASHFRLDDWRIERLDGDRVFLEMDYAVGTPTRKTSGSALFELQWRGGDLAFVGHRKEAARAKITGGPDPGNDACIYNYYSPRPCLDVMRKWSEFAALHDLPMDQESAAILQAYKQLDYDRGDELMATVKGLTPPVERSVFALQNEVTAMNLPGAGRETDCAWNPYAPNPCPEALRIFRAFAERYGLEADDRTARMFEAYSRGDFKKADVVYALAKNLDVPAYGHIPSIAGRDLASYWPQLNHIYEYGGNECEMKPHSQKPCWGLVPLWREFAARYGIDDTPENGRIFEAYYQGNFEKGDTHLAEAFGVPLETLLEASGVPGDGLVIEVYPGWRQMLRDLLIGT